MSGKAIRETLAALGVIASMVFVGWRSGRATSRREQRPIKRLGSPLPRFGLGWVRVRSQASSSLSPGTRTL